MIQYALKCQDGHGFESWFKSADAFDALAKAGHLSCAVCGSPEVSKAIMAPRVAAPREAAPPPPAEAKAPAPRAPEEALARALSELRRRVEANSDYVGRRFAQEARAMHLGDKPERAIYGEARPEEARQLLEEGVPLLPLPFTPKKKLS